MRSNKLLRVLTVGTASGILASGLALLPAAASAAPVSDAASQAVPAQPRPKPRCRHYRAYYTRMYHRPFHDRMGRYHRGYYTRMYHRARTVCR